MASMIYDVKFYYEGDMKFWEKHAKGMIERLFVSYYGQYCKLVNPMWEVWNKEFDQTHPGHIVDPDDENDIYNKFIVEKIKKHVIGLIDEDPTFKFDYVFDPGFIMLPKDGNGRMYFLLYPENE